MPEQPYAITYAEEAARDIRSLRAYEQRRIIDAIEKHLQVDPTRESKVSIKRMGQPFWSEYRLRVGDFRVYYDVDLDQRRVNLLRVLWKGTSETPGNPTP